MTTSQAQSIAIGGAIDETRATLSLHGEALNPEELSRQMGAEPSASYRKGDRISVGREDVRPSGFWSIQVDVRAPENAEDAIARLLALLPAGEDFWAALQADYRIDLSLTMVVKAWNRGFALSPATLRELSRRGLALTCEVYAEPQPLTSGCS